MWRSEKLLMEYRGTDKVQVDSGENVKSGEASPQSVLDAPGRFLPVETPKTESECEKMKKDPKAMFVNMKMPLGFKWKKIENPYPLDSGTNEKIILSDKPSDLKLNIGEEKIVSRYWDVDSDINSNMIVQTGSTTLNEYLKIKYALDVDTCCLTSEQVRNKINLGEVSALTEYVFNESLDLYLNLRAANLKRMNKKNFLALKKPSDDELVNATTEFFVPVSSDIDTKKLCGNDLLFICYTNANTGTFKSITKHTFVASKVDEKEPCKDSTEFWIYPKQCVCQMIEKVVKKYKDVKNNKGRYWIKMKDDETIDDYVKVFIPQLEALLVESIISGQTSCVLSKKQQVHFGLFSKKLPENAYVEIQPVENGPTYYFRLRHEASMNRIKKILHKDLPIPSESILNKSPEKEDIVINQVFPTIQLTCEKDDMFKHLKEDEAVSSVIVMMMNKMFNTENKFSSKLNDICENIPGISVVKFITKGVYKIVTCTAGFLMRNPFSIMLITSIGKVLKILICLYTNGVKDVSIIFGLAKMMLKRFIRPGSMFYATCVEFINIMHCALKSMFSVTTFSVVEFIRTVRTTCLQESNLIKGVFLLIGRSGDIALDFIGGTISHIFSNMSSFVNPEAWFKWLSSQSPFAFAQASYGIREITNIIDKPMDYIKFDIALRMIVKNPKMFLNGISMMVVHLPVPEVFDQIVQRLSDTLSRLTGSKIDIYTEFNGICSAFGDKIMNLSELVAGFKAFFDFLQFFLELLICNVKKYLSTVVVNAGSIETVSCCDSVQTLLITIDNQLNAKKDQEVLMNKEWSDLSWSDSFKRIARNVDYYAGNEVEETPSTGRIKDLHKNAEEAMQFWDGNMTFKFNALKSFLVEYNTDPTFAVLCDTGASTVADNRL